MDRHSNRCANSEALARYEREMAKNEALYEQKCQDMYDELEELYEQFSEIKSRYELYDEAKEYMKDLVC